VIAVAGIALFFFLVPEVLLRLSFNSLFDVGYMDYSVSGYSSTESQAYGSHTWAANGSFFDGKDFRAVYRHRDCGSSGCGCGDDHCFIVEAGGEGHYRNAKKQVVQ